MVLLVVLKKIQIQPMLRLNNVSDNGSAINSIIQIQPMLRLNQIVNFAPSTVAEFKYNQC